MSQRAKFLLLITLFIVPTIASFVVFYFFHRAKPATMERWFRRWWHCRNCVSRARMPPVNK